MRKLILLFIFISVCVSCSNMEPRRGFRNRKLSSVVSRHLSCWPIFKNLIKFNQKKAQEIKILVQNILKFNAELEHFVLYEASDLNALVETNNQIMQKMYKIIKEDKVKVELKEKELSLAGQNLTYFYLKFVSLDKARSRIFKNISRHFNRSSIDKLTIDVLSAVKKMSSGYYDEKSREITLSSQFMIDILREELPGHIFSHEISHDYLKGARKKRPWSIFNIVYKAKNMGSLYAGGIYQKYMSLEELYNYSNQLFWSLSPQKIKNLLNLKKDNPDFVTLYKSFTLMARGIAHQTKTMANRSKNFFKFYEESSILYYGTVWKRENADYFSFEIDEDVFTDRIIQQNDFEFIDLFQRLERFMQDNNITSFVNNPTWTRESIPESHRKDFFSMYDQLLVMEKKIMNRLIKQDEMLIDLAEYIRNKAFELNDEIEKVGEKYQQYLVGKVTYSEMLQELQELRITFRYFGSLTRGL